ncbi:iron-sulfur cluster repair di-iron protein [Paenibacillus sp. Leaf72]|uniref:iron-sulfur cluster repair di-iron protein n=1 Tax=Paenibacillus sp. Leaf72 TaxID=1736234 RepID=UPI0006F1FF22|nr:iron-sulfur cluster repair di-iron protein [Paenibacillus sp. Leaf72]KQO17288.1 iron-sulfur cluster repair di-iron protein [Paenibacillus sp. Leaf72]
MTIFNGTEKIGEIVTRYPGASNLLRAYNIDFCCGGNRSLHTVLRQQGTDAALFLSALNENYAEASKHKGEDIDWSSRSYTELIEHVIQTHHVYVQQELPLLSEFTTKILRVHGHKQADVLPRLHRLFHEMKLELEQHLIDEEEQIFPLIRQYEQEPSPELHQKLTAAITELESEHSQVGDLLKEMRAVTHHYELPEGACRTYTLTFQKLEELETDLFQHIHLENNILFPRVLQIA